MRKEKINCTSFLTGLLENFHVFYSQLYIDHFCVLFCLSLRAGFPIRPIRPGPRTQEFEGRKISDFFYRNKNLRATIKNAEEARNVFRDNAIRESQLRIRSISNAETRDVGRYLVDSQAYTVCSISSARIVKNQF